MKKDFLSITDIAKQEIEAILQHALVLKKDLQEGRSNAKQLENKSLVMIFEKPSLRTRLSFEIGMQQLGGFAVFLSPSDIGLGVRESIADTAKVISGMGDIIMARVKKHETVASLATHASVPVINGLSDVEHPCQILADLLTIYEKKGKLAGLTVAYIGDGENNVTNSFVFGAARMGMNFICASPKGFCIDKEILSKAKSINAAVSIDQTDDPSVAVMGADVVVTDTWVSMGDENEAESRLKALKAYQVNVKLLKKAKPDAIFLHCLPAHRGQEVTEEVIDGPQSVVFDEAENRLHAQKALLLHLLQ